MEFIISRIATVMLVCVMLFGNTAITSSNAIDAQSTDSPKDPIVGLIEEYIQYENDKDWEKHKHIFTFRALEYRPNQLTGEIESNLSQVISAMLEDYIELPDTFPVSGVHRDCTCPAKSYLLKENLAVAKETRGYINGPNFTIMDFLYEDGAWRISDIMNSGRGELEYYKSTLDPQSGGEALEDADRAIHIANIRMQGININNQYRKVGRTPTEKVTNTTIYAPPMDDY